MSFKIESISAFISVDANGEEGILASLMPSINGDGKTWMPLIMADEKRLLVMRPIAERAAKVQNKQIKLVRFTTRTDIETLESK